MKANSLQKKSITIEQIYENIDSANERGDFKWFIPHFTVVDNEIKLQLLGDGFKISTGDWDNIMINALIIEW